MVNINVIQTKYEVYKKSPSGEHFGYKVDIFPTEAIARGFLESYPHLSLYIVKVTSERLGD